jgi:hypothetical protein
VLLACGVLVSTTLKALNSEAQGRERLASAPWVARRLSVE